MISKIIAYLYLLIKIGALSKDLRIIGGVESDIVEAPYLVSLRLYDTNSLKCSGAIISNKHILTAAHCLYKKIEFFPRLRIYAGTSVLCGKCGSIYRIDRAFIHPDFTESFVGNKNFHNDIAIIEIKETIHFNNLEKKIDLPVEDVVDGSDAILAGWGLTTYDWDINPNNLQKIIVKTINVDDCKQKIPYPVLQDQLCTYAEGMASCVGDSGGPVVNNNKIIGIISYSVPDVPNTPDIHTKVFSHLNFIKSIINT